MSNQFLIEDNITAFPLGTGTSKNRVLSERNLVNWFNSLYDTKDFIINTNFSHTQDFAFILHGYYFKINKTANEEDHPFYKVNNNSQNYGNIYAVIFISNDQLTRYNDGTSSIMILTDNVSNIDMGKREDTTSIKYYMQLFKDGNIVPSYKLIDGGEYE